MEENLPIMDSGCGACMDEETKADSCSTNLDSEDSVLERVLQNLGGRNSKKGKVLVAMSGGVDSCVLAAIISGLGYEGIGVHMKFWAEEVQLEDSTKLPENKCCSLESLVHARQVAHKYKMPFFVLNTKDVFKKEIVDYFVDGFESGVTPNPCIECNRSIKFGYLLDKMRQYGADFVATGHYVESYFDGNEFVLKTAEDKLKDQSYFLYTLTQEKLKHCLFPLANLTKQEVRAIARQEGLSMVSEKKDSQGICFFPESSFIPFLSRNMNQEKNASGKMVKRDGTVMGNHKGLAYYTIGQRQGLEIGGPGGPWFVIGKNPKENELIVGGNDELFTSKITARNLSFVSNNLPKTPMKILARIRHRFTPTDAVLNVLEDGKVAEIEYEAPQRAITPGQSIVFYDGEKVIGGGIITSTL